MLYMPDSKLIRHTKEILKLYSNAARLGKPGTFLKSGKQGRDFLFISQQCQKIHLQGYVDYYKRLETNHISPRKLPTLFVRVATAMIGASCCQWTIETTFTIRFFHYRLKWDSPLTVKFEREGAIRSRRTANDNQTLHNAHWNGMRKYGACSWQNPMLLLEIEEAVSS